MRPLIGIPCHADYRDGSRRPVYCNNRAYVHAVERAGGVPALIPLYDDLSLLDTLLPRLDGLAALRRRGYRAGALRRRPTSAGG